jgi:hypothetical protein
MQLHIAFLRAGTPVLFCGEKEVVRMSITIKPVEKPAMSKVAGAVLCG